MTATDFAIARKLNRAGRHLKELDRTIKRYLGSQANGVVNDFESEPGFLIVRAVSNREPPPSCNVLIGDFLYNIRAALDYTACELVRANNQSVDEHTEFPIFLRPEDFRNPISGELTRAIKNRIGRMSAEHQAIIEEEQPYQARYGAQEDDPLAILYRLSNYDRHQFIHLTSVIANTSFQNFTPPHASARFEQVSVSYGAFKSQAEVARFRILDGPEIEVYVRSNVRFDVAFDDGGPGAGRQVLKTLSNLIIRVAEVIQRF